MLKQLILPFTVIFSLIFTVIALFPEQPEKQGPQSDQSEPPIAFHNVHVIPMSGDQPILKDQTVLVKGDRITFVGDADQIELGEGVMRVNGSGKYLIPGLTEMHGHIPPSVRTEQMPDYMNRKYVEHTLFLYVANGVTTVRGMLGYEGQLELREEVIKGEILGPTLYLAGPSFNGSTVESPQQAAERVKKQVEEGWDLLKIHPGLTNKEYAAVAETANRLQIPFGGHVPSEVGIEQALLSGQISIDHIDGYVDHIRSFPEEDRDSVISDVIEKTLNSGTWIVPTMALWETIIGAADHESLLNYEELKYVPEQVRDNYADFLKNEEASPYFDPDAELHARLRTHLLKKMNESGVQIVMGTDAPQLFSVPGFSLHREFPKMKEAGMDNMAILRSATANAGRYFNPKDMFGTIELGKRADLLLLNDNPLEDLTTLREPEMVVIRGKVLTRSEILNGLKEIERYYSQDN